MTDKNPIPSNQEEVDETDNTAVSEETAQSPGTDHPQTAPGTDVPLQGQDIVEPEAAAVPDEAIKPQANTEPEPAATSEEPDQPQAEDEAEVGTAPEKILQPNTDVVSENTTATAESDQQEGIGELESASLFQESDQYRSEIEAEPEMDHLSKLALQLFHGTQRLHNLDSEDQEILLHAIRLRNVPLPTTKKKPFLSEFEQVDNQIDLILNEQGKSVLSGVIGYTQGKLKGKDLNMQEIDPSLRHKILTIAAIQQIAEGLDESGAGSTTIEKIEPSEDGMWIVITDPSEEIDEVSAKKSARLWKKIGYPNIEVLLPEQAARLSIPFPAPQAKIGILPDDPLSEAGRKVMRFHFAEMLRHEEGTRLGEDIEALHDMRVATRRLRAAFEVFGSAFDKQALRKHLKGLRMTGRTLGAVRDMDVFMEKAQKYLQTLPETRQSGLDPLLKHWKEQREAARAVMISYLDSWEYAQFKYQFNVFLNRPFAGARMIQEEQPEPVLVRQIAPVLIYTRMASVRAFETLLDQAPIELLHMLRIEFKKLRYTVEYFREVLGKRAIDVIEEIKILQDHLGDLNDAQVATEILGEFIVDWERTAQTAMISERESIEEVVSYMAARHAERHRLLTSFNETWSLHFNQKSFRRKIAQAVSLL